VADGGSVDAADAAPSCTPRIAYGTGRDAVDFASNIFTMNIDGSDQKRVNTSDGLYQSPIWSPDGRTLLMFCNFGLCSLPAAGGPAVTLTQIGGDFESGGSWTPDSQRIVYADAEESPSTKSYIWIMNADSSGKQRLTSSGADGQPRVSPDGTKISFVSTRDGNAEIYTMNLDGTAQTNLSHHVGNDGVDNITAGLWSPDGSQLLFVSDGDPNIDEDIFVVPAAGGTVRPVANVDANDSAPAWSPDGAKIAWVHGSGIRVMNADGSAQVEVTDGSSEDSAPVWIDATHLVFVRYSGQNEGADDIFSAEAKANATVTRLTNDPHGDIAPAFTACARP
jgi:TolB protein